MRIACVNNYPLEKMMRLASIGESTRQHCWGVDHLLSAGHDVTFAPFREPHEAGVLGSIASKTKFAFGQLDQEVSVLRQGRASWDAVYCADQGSARGLALMPARFRPPVVAVMHHPEPAWLLQDRLLRGYRQIICLTNQVALELKNMGLTDRAVRLAPWGPDLESDLYAVTVDESLGVVSSGKSNRAPHVLVDALRTTGQKGLVYDTSRSVGTAPDNVTVVQPGGIGMDPAARDQYLATAVLRRAARAAVIAIPISNPSRLTGLTEVNDALAMGKPIIMTRSPYHPIDIEEIGCGLLVEPDDRQGWIDALSELADASTRRQMGENGRAFARLHWNYQLFCREVSAALVTA